MYVWERWGLLWGKITVYKTSLNWQGNGETNFGNKFECEERLCVCRNGPIAVSQGQKLARKKVFYKTVDKIEEHENFFNAMVACY